MWAATLHDLFSIIWFTFARNWMATWRNESIDSQTYYNSTMPNLCEVCGFDMDAEECICTSLDN